MSEIVFIGTSDAFSSGGRRQSAILARTGSGSILLDCGTTTLAGLVTLGVDRREIDAIAVSHFHGDHFGGIPALLLACLYEDRRREPLRIAGPLGIERRVRELADAMGYGIEDRDWTFDIHFDELPAGSETDVGPVHLRSFETRHQPDVCPHGLIVTSGSERIAYSGDTGWFDELPRIVGGSNLFICECTYATFDFEYHLSLRELSARKHEFDCGRMILTHLGSEMAERRGAVEFETADDGLKISI